MGTDLTLREKLEHLGYKITPVDGGWYVTRYPYAPNLGTYSTEQEAVEAAHREALNYNDYRIQLGLKPKYPFLRKQPMDPERLERLVAEHYEDKKGIRAANFRLGYDDRTYGLQRDDNPFWSRLEPTINLDKEPSKAAQDWYAGWDACSPLPDQERDHE